MLNDSTILITGGSGSFGNKFVEMTLEKYNPKKIIIFCRDEMKQWEMANKFKRPDVLRFFLGDVRDKDRLRRACNGVDFIVHAAAGKIVPTAEYNPFEYVKTNVNGAMNLIDSAIDCGVKRVVALSTDKACNPVNLYGATKLCSDKLFIAGNYYSGDQDTSFSIVRYGNVMGSRGSIIPHFLNLAKTGEIPITDERMTRFMITLDNAVKTVWHALGNSEEGTIYVRKCPTIRVVDIAEAIAPKAKLVFTGIRPGEKLHEIMISLEDARSTFEYPEYYQIRSQLFPLPENVNGIQCQDNFAYSSDTNKEWLSKEELKDWIRNEYEITI